MVSKTFSVLGVLLLAAFLSMPAQAAQKTMGKGRSIASISPGSSVAVPDPLDLSHMKPAWFTSAKMPAAHSVLGNPAMSPVVLGGKYSFYDDSGASVLSPRRNPLANGYFFFH